MSNFFSVGYLKPQYFNAKYLSGGNEGQSGWRRLIISQLQEAGLIKVEAQQKEQIPTLDSTIVPAAKISRKGVVRNLRTPEPEEGVAREVLKALPKLMYRSTGVANPTPELEVLLQYAKIELSELWAKLGVLSGIVDNPLEIETKADLEDDDLVMLLIAA